MATSFTPNLALPKPDFRTEPWHDSWHDAMEIIDEAIGRVLTANLTFYVRTDGNDANDGLANTAAGAFLTIQHALDVASEIDTRGFDITISFNLTAITEQLVFKPPKGSGSVDIIGPGSATATITTAGKTISAERGGSLGLNGFKIVSTGNKGLVAKGLTKIFLGSDVNFGACLQSHMHIQNAMVTTSGYKISGAATRHIEMTNFGSYYNDGTITITGTPAFSIAFVTLDGAGCTAEFFGSAAFSGSATGKRFSITGLGQIATYGKGLTFLPGDVAGTSPSTVPYYT